MKTTTTLRNWIDTDGLTIDDVVCDELMDYDGIVYEGHGHSEGQSWFVNGLIVVESSSVGTRVVDEDEADRLREWINAEDRASDSSVPNMRVWE
jgi:hypothetical protein